MDIVQVLCCAVWLCVVRCVGGHSLKRGRCEEGFLECERGDNWRSNMMGDTCFKSLHLCDNVTDCSDGSDEKYCSSDFNYGLDGFAFRYVQGPCPKNYVLCVFGEQKHPDVNDTRCFKKNFICDREHDCHDEHDEMFCPYRTELDGNHSSGTPHEYFTGFHFRFSQGDCPDGFYECRNGTARNSQDSVGNANCIKQTWICDGQNDCNDKSDEDYCPYFFLTDIHNLTAVLRTGSTRTSGTGDTQRVTDQNKISSCSTPPTTSSIVLDPTGIINLILIIFIIAFLLYQYYQTPRPQCTRLFNIASSENL